MSDSEEPLDPFFGSGEDLRPFLLNSLANKERNVYTLSHKRKHSVDSDIEADTNSPFVERGDSSLLTLPDELLLHIFSFLAPQNLCILAYVSKRISALSTDNNLWKETVKLSQYTSTKKMPFWAKNWKTVWHWYQMIRKRKFDENDTNKNGFGYCITSDGTIYEGHWKNNLEDDFGIKKWPDEARYEGYWLEGKFHGQGLHVWSSGSYYLGGWEHHKRNGNGLNFWIIGDSYVGNWLDDKKNGFGVYCWKDGRIYKGFFFFSKIQELKFIQGFWKEDHRHGKGFYKIGENWTYEGDWKDDKIRGMGLFKWSDGDSYQGEWVDGRRCGKGFLTTFDGKVYQQEWEEESFDETDKGTYEGLKPIL